MIILVIKFKILLNLFSTHKIACSLQSGKFLYYGNFDVVNNGIDLNKFAYSEQFRNEIRKQYQIKSNEKVIGHVGRFVDVKNHNFIIDILKKISDSNYEVKLLLVGDGPNMHDIKEKVKKYHLLDNVIFVGNVSDSYKYYSAMDLLFFPSLYEGIPLTLIEAQANGLSIVASNKIDEKVKLTDKIVFFDLNDNVESIILLIKNSLSNSNHIINFNKLLNSDYSIHKTVKKLENIYSGKVK